MGEKPDPYDAMMRDRAQQDAAVRNAADKEQIKAAEKSVQHRHQQDLLDLLDVLKLPAGRRLLWRWIQAFRPVKPLSSYGEFLQYKAGEHDAAIFMLQEINQADPDAEVLMMIEARERAKADAAIAQRPRKKEKPDEFKEE